MQALQIPMVIPISPYPAGRLGHVVVSTDGDGGESGRGSSDPVSGKSDEGGVT